MSEAIESGQDLVTIAKADTYSVFVDQTKIEPYLKKVRTVIDGFEGDVSTPSGRKAIASMAYRVTKIKTYIEGLGKDLAAEQKEAPKKIDATRKYARETLEGWADEVRQPLTDWETVEAARVKKHTDTLTLLDTFTRGEYPQTVEAIKANIETVTAIVVGPACDEFEAYYARAVEASGAALREALASAEKIEADRLELEALRKKQAERDAADRDAELHRQTAEKAKKEAEEAAQAKLDRVEAEAKAGRDAAAQREADLKLAAERADQAARDTEARLRREADEKAAQEERDRLAREEDTKHRASINRAAFAAFVEGGIDEESAKKVIALIAKKMIPAIVIQY